MKNGLGVRRRLALDIFSNIEDKRIAAHELRTIMWEAIVARHPLSDHREVVRVLLPIQSAQSCHLCKSTLYRFLYGLEV